MVNLISSNQPNSSGMMQYRVKSLCTLATTISMLFISATQNVAAVELKSHYASGASPGSESSLSAYSIVKFTKIAVNVVIFGVVLCALAYCCCWVNALSEYQRNNPEPYYLDHPPTFVETVTGIASARQRRYEKWQKNGKDFAENWSPFNS